MKDDTASGIGFQSMSSQLLKPCAIVALSLALLYSGVAWTMETCAHHAEHTDHALTQDHHSFQVSSKNRDAHETVPVIHCTSLNEQVGPAVRIASTEIRRWDKSIALHAPSLSAAHFVPERRALWLEALFRNGLMLSLVDGLARHLFLSVLQI